MFEPLSGPRLFGIAPGADFPRLLARGLRARMAGQPPEALARAEVWVNTARMQSRLREALIAEGPGFLPRIRLIAELAGPGDEAPLRARLELAQLVRQLLQAEPDLGPTSAAFPLADSLFRLLDEMAGEGVTLDDLATLDVSAHSLHWERSLRFIRLIGGYLGPSAGSQARLRTAVLQLVERWRVAPPAHPLIVAGSTGSRGPTAMLMRAVARLPQGALVLPGYDFAQPGRVWSRLDRAIESEDHPQFRYAHLLDGLDARPDAVRPWSPEPPPDPTRNALVSLALRPAPVTDQWLHDGPALGDLMAPTEALTLIEAPSPRDEAHAIALILRDAAVTGQRAALITPDRLLARRVTAALDRWHLRPDDSAGRPLGLSAPGRFLRQCVGLLAGGSSAEALMALLKHPITHSATGRGPHLLRLRELELALRRDAIPYPDAATLAVFAARDPERAPWAEWLTQALVTLPEPGEYPLSQWVAALDALALTLAAGAGGEGTGELWLAEAGVKAEALLADLRTHAGHGGALSGRDFAALFDTLFVGAQVREVQEVRPEVMIWGTLEARAQGADLVVLGGLNEGTWPSAPAPDPWFNRAMRVAAGLLLPEREIGLSAHDFQQAIGAPRVVLSRARRDAEAETVPARWLNRLTNLIGGLRGQRGPEALAAMRARGAGWLAQAAALEADLRSVPAACAARNPRPAPAPPASARLSELPVTRVQTLIRDPYAIYAERILRLPVLKPLAPEPDARLKGTVLHKIPEAYVALHPPGTPGSLADFFALAERILAEEIAWPATRLHWRARLHRVAAEFVAWNAGLDGVPEASEERGRITLGMPPFTLTGQPDRIDRAPDGRLRLYDYKTGTPPTPAQQKHFDKQLILLAIMAEEGAFKGVAPDQVASAEFIGLGSKFARVEAPVAPADLAEHRARFLQLVARYRRPEQGFTALRAVELERHHGDYDALARRGEWQPGDPAEAVAVGDADG